MKKIFTVILTISVLLTLSINCFATEATYTLDLSQYEQYKDELAEIVALVKERPQEYDFFDDMEIEKLEDFFTQNTLVYPSYYCDAKITAATADDFASIIPTEHKWHIKTGGNTTTFKLKNGKWAWGGAGINPNYTDADFIDFTSNGLKAIFKEKLNIDSFDDVKLLKIDVDSSQSFYAYAKSGEQEYLICLEKNGLLEKDEVYTAKQAVYVFLSEIKAQKESIKLNGGEVLIGGGNITTHEDYDFSKIDLTQLKTLEEEINSLSKADTIAEDVNKDANNKFNDTIYIILALVFTAALVAAAVVLGFKKKKA